MASGVPHSTGTGDYVKAPENYQREMPLSEQLLQVKESAKGKFNEFADQANLKFEQSKNDPSNRASDERLQRDLDTTAADAKSSTNQAINQVSSVFNAMKGAFTSTRNEGTATPTTTPAMPESAPARPAQSVSESLGQTAAAITDAVKNAVTPRRVTAPGTQPGLNNAATNVPPQDVVGTQPAAATTNLPQDVPRRAPPLE